MRKLAMMLCLAAAGCGGGGTSTDPDLEPGGPNVLTPAGGTITLQNGAVTIEAPAGAVTANVALSVVPITDRRAFPGDASLVIGSLYQLSASPAATLLKPLRITLRYDAAMGPAGVPEHHYGMAQVSNNAWSQLSGAVADTATNLVTGEVQSFGMVAVRRGNPSESCTAPEFRQFDFWLGSWTVGTIQSDITTEPSGCAIFELYRAPVHGHSISVYDPRTNQWYQTYHPGVAPHYSMSGRIEDGRMVLFVYDGGGARVQRWTWEANADGTVTQRAASTSDDGISWQPNFSGVYRRR